VKGGNSKKQKSWKPTLLKGNARSGGKPALATGGKNHVPALERKLKKEVLNWRKKTWTRLTKGGGEGRPENRGSKEISTQNEELEKDGDELGPERKKDLTKNTVPARPSYEEGNGRETREHGVSHLHSQRQQTWD